MGHTLKNADIIFVLGSNDIRVAEHATRLFKEGWAPLMVVSGDGTKHASKLLKNTHGGKTEAEVLSALAIEQGVPRDKIILEEEANNTGQNFEFTRPILNERGINVKTAIVVQKPFMERRAYATGKVQWPETELIVTSPSGTFWEYTNDTLPEEETINVMVGDLERIKKYPKKGFQIEQEIPKKIWSAFEYLVSCGYTKHLTTE